VGVGFWVVVMKWGGKHFLKKKKNQGVCYLKMGGGGDMRVNSFCTHFGCLIHFDINCL